MLQILTWNGKNNPDNSKVSDRNDPSGTLMQSFVRSTIEKITGLSNPDNCRLTETTTGLSTTENDVPVPRKSFMQSIVRNSVDGIVGYSNSFRRRHSNSVENITDDTTELSLTENGVPVPRGTFLQSIVRSSVDGIVGYNNSFKRRHSSIWRRVVEQENELNRVRAHCQLCVEESWAELERVEREKDELLLKCQALEKENLELRNRSIIEENKVSDYSCGDNITSDSSINIEKCKQRKMKWFEGLDVSDETRDWILANDSAKQITNDPIPQKSHKRNFLSMDSLADHYSKYGKDSQQKRGSFSALGFLVKTTDRERELLEQNETLQRKLNELTLKFADLENQLKEKEEFMPESKEHEERDLATITSTVKLQISTEKKESPEEEENHGELYVDFGYRDND